MSEKQPSLPPGFRFHPTDEELIIYYLKNTTNSRPCPFPIIAEVDIYKFNPWDLPDKAVFGDKEWYFFTPRDRKYPNGIRPSRAAGSGYWKATGTDKPIVSSSSGRRVGVGVKKALVFYKGKPPRGSKTNWIMHEYRLVNGRTAGCSRPLNGRALDSSPMRLDDLVLCRIYEKKNQHAKPKTDHTEEEEGSSRNVNVNDDNHFRLPISSNMPKVTSLTDIFQDPNSDLCRLIYSNPQQLHTIDSNLVPHENSIQIPNQIINYCNNINGSSDGGMLNVSAVSADPRLGYHRPMKIDCGGVIGTVFNGDSSRGVQINQETKFMVSGNTSSRRFCSSSYGFLDQNNLLDWNNSQHLG